MTTPTGGPPPGAASRPVLGLPLWAWGVIGAVAVGAIIFLRLRRGSSSAAGGTTVQVPSDQQIGLTQYEQISSQLTGLEGTQAALLESIKDLQGEESQEGDRDKDRDHDCPRGRHWDPDERRCVKDEDDDKDGGGRRHRVTVPDVTERRYPQAARELEHAGLVAHRATPYVGVVESQEPKAGSRVREHSVVTLAGKKAA